MGYVREIRQNSIDSHQVSPGYVLTFTRWSNRSTFNYKQNGNNLDVRPPLVVYSDAIQVTTSDTKKQQSPTVTMVLKGGDINYSTAVAPGDFVTVNMLNWESDAERVRDKAIALQPINEIGDGYKGVYKVQSVVKSVKVDKRSGKKTLFYTVTAAGFTEFNNVMYYNPALVAAFSQVGTTLYQTAVGQFYQDLLKTNSEIQVLLKALFKILIGKSNKDNDAKVKNFGNTHFKIPTALGRLLGKNNITYANELYNYVIGIWKDSRTGGVGDQRIGSYFNPSFVQGSEGNFYSTGIPLQGNKEVVIENWNNQTAWSILQSYTNSILNEMYTTYRVGPDNRIHPTVVVRQKPFTTEHFKPPQGFNVTRFFQLPRWKISANLLYDLQTSKNDAARFNFVQVFTRQLADTAPQDMAQQTALGNFVTDEGDIQRNGLRPFVVASNFDWPVKDRNKKIRAKEWAQIISDWIIDGHLKESGVLTFQGIQDPVAVGDNIEFDNIVYHIEAISHTMTVVNDKKTFTTKITVSYGMDLRSSKQGPVYANMDHTDAQTNNEEDWENERILPGVSDSQNIRGRVQGEEVEATKQSSFTQPNLRKTRRKTEESNTGQDPNYGEYDNGKSIGKKNRN